MESKTCNECRRELPIESFSMQKGRRRGRCRECVSAADRAAYADRSSGRAAKIRANAAQRRNKVRELIARVKDVPCADCGVKYPTPVMEFDHLGDKLFKISRAEYVSQRLLDEIAKCEVVCANCHRLRTAKRGQWAGWWNEPVDAL